jgi:hypothetical protein
MLQFANYPEQQPVGSSTCWSDEQQGAVTGQPPAPKKRPRAVGHGELVQAMPPTQDVDALDEIYVWDDRLSVLRFIEDARVRGLLLDARQSLDEAFGYDAIKSLSLVRDDEGFDTLFCLVKTRAELAVATRALREFDEHWWLARSEDAAGKVNFDFDLI